MGLTTSPPSMSQLSSQCGILYISRPSRPLTAIALLYYLTRTGTVMHLTAQCNSRCPHRHVYNIKRQLLLIFMVFYRRGPPTVHIMPTSLNAGWWPLCGMSWLTVLWPPHTAVQVMLQELPFMQWAWPIQLPRVCTASPFGPTQQPVCSVLRFGQSARVLSLWQAYR
jgi:hypothetical protein